MERSKGHMLRKGIGIGMVTLGKTGRQFLNLGKTFWQSLQLYSSGSEGETRSLDASSRLIFGRIQAQEC